jgi:hypothetical protein
MVNGALNFSALSFFARNLLPSFSMPATQATVGEDAQVLALGIHHHHGTEAVLGHFHQGLAHGGAVLHHGVAAESTSFTFMVIRRVST